MGAYFRDQKSGPSNIHLCSITLHPITVHSSNVAPILVLVKDGPLFILWIYFYFYPILTSPPIPLHSLTSSVLLQLMLPPPVGWSAFLSYHIPTPICSMTLHCHLLCTSSIIAPIPMLVSDGPIFCPLYLFPFLSHSIPCLSHPVPFPCPHLLCTLSMVGFPFSFASHYPTGWSAFFVPKINLYPSPHSITSCVLLQYCSHPHSHSHSIPPHLISSHIPFPFPFLHHPHSIPSPLVHSFNCCSHSPVGWSAFLPIHIPSHFHSVLILFHLISFHSYPFLSHHLLYTPSVVALILLSDGPLFCPFPFHSIPSHFHSVSLLFHLISIPSPLVYSFNCCSHSPVGWSAFLPILIPSHFHSVLILFHLISFHSYPFLSHHLLYTPSIVALILLSDGPLFCPFSFHPTFILFCFYSISFQSYPFLSHHLLYTPSVVALILLSDGPLFCPFPFHSIPSHFHSVSLLFHLISIPSPLVYSFNCSSHSPVGWSAFLPILIPSHFHSVLILFHLISFHSYPFLSHHLLYTPSVVALILLSDGPLFCPVTFHLISIPSPLVYSFTCCSHSHVGWSAFLVPMICPHAIPIPSYLIPFPFLEKSGWSGSIYTLSRYLM